MTQEKETIQEKLAHRKLVNNDIMNNETLHNATEKMEKIWDFTSEKAAQTAQKIQEKAPEVVDNVMESPLVKNTIKKSHNIKKNLMDNTMKPENPKKKRHILRKILGFGIAGALLVGTFTAFTASGAETKRKEVATLGHIDSPRAYWENNSFVLRNEFKYGEVQPLIDDTVIWIGKGWDPSKSPATSNYSFVIPHSDDHFLGPEGNVLYSSPAVPGIFSNEPAWVGMGAVKEIPTNTFRDQQFTLDIVGFSGPGRMEMFNAYPEGDSTHFRRLLSSHDPRYRSFWMSAGNHTHNYTTFTKPGKYDITYRVEARDKKTGKIISSKSQVQEWQVGGVNPDDEDILDVNDAYTHAKSTCTTGCTHPIFSTRPLTAEEQTRDGDQYLTRLSFDTGNKKDNGTVVFTIEGYYLTQRPVENGRAQWDELLGSKTSVLQARFIPSDGSVNARWLSAPLHFDPQHPAASTQDSATTPVPAHTDDPTPAFNENTQPISDTSLTVRTAPDPHNEDNVIVTIQSPDKRLHARLYGGVVDAKKPNDSSYCKLDSILDKGSVKATLDTDLCYDPDIQNILHLQVSPHPLNPSPGQTINIANFVKGKRQVAHVNLNSPTGVFIAEDADTGHAGDTATTPQPAQPAPANPQPVAPAPAPAPTQTPVRDRYPHADFGTSCTNDKPCLFTQGHTDIFWVGDKKDNKDPHDLYTAMKEDITGTGVVRDPRSAILFVDGHSYTEQTQHLAGIEKPTYTLPLTQNPALLWPGIDTLDIRGGHHTSTTFHLDSLTVPEGGHVYAYIPKGGLSQKMKGMSDSGSLELKQNATITLPNPTHVHFYWSFTKPGKYVMKVHAVVDGNITTEPATYTWEVEPSEKDPNAAPAPAPAPAPSPVAPTPEPSTPVTPAPVQPQPVAPQPQPEQPTPAPVQPQPKPVVPKPVAPGPTTPQPTKPSTGEGTVTTPAQPPVVKPAPTTPAKPVVPAPVTPVKPAPSEPATPQPVVPTPQVPTPSKPIPTKPVPNPTAPTPSGSAPTDSHTSTPAESQKPHTSHDVHASADPQAKTHKAQAEPQKSPQKSEHKTLAHTGSNSVIGIVLFMCSLLLVAVVTSVRKTLKFMGK